MCQKENTQVLLSKNELNKLPNNSSNVFKKSNIDGALIDQIHYLVVESIVLWITCYVEFSAYYTIDNKPDQLFEYQPNEFQGKLIEENREECSYPKQIKLVKQISNVVK